MIYLIMLLFSGNVLIDENVLRQLLPNAKLNYTEKEEKKEQKQTDTTNQQIDQIIEDTTNYEYDIQLKIESRANNQKLSFELPSIEMASVRQIPSTLKYGLGTDTSNTIARYTGKMLGGRLVQQTRGSTTYAKTTTANLGITQETWTAYNTGMSISLQVDTKKDKNPVLQITYNYSIPAGTETPPSTQTSSYSTVANIEDDKEVKFSGITYYAYKKSWYLFGFGRTLEKMDMSIHVKIKRLN